MVNNQLEGRRDESLKPLSLATAVFFPGFVVSRELLQSPIYSIDPTVSPFMRPDFIEGAPYDDELVDRELARYRGDFSRFCYDFLSVPERDLIVGNIPNVNPRSIKNFHPIKLMLAAERVSETGALNYEYSDIYFQDFFKSSSGPIEPTHAGSIERAEWIIVRDYVSRHPAIGGFLLSIALDNNPSGKKYATNIMSDAVIRPIESTLIRPFTYSEVLSVLREIGVVKILMNNTDYYNVKFAPGLEWLKKALTFVPKVWEE